MTNGTNDAAKTNGNGFLVRYERFDGFDTVQINAADATAAQTEFYRTHKKGVVVRVTPRHVAAPFDGKLNARSVRSASQATRNAPAATVTGWNVETPVGVVYCPTIEAARQLAESFGCEIIL